MKAYFLLLPLALSFAACTEDAPPSDVTKIISKNGSVEVVFRTVDLSDGNTELQIEYKVWKDGMEQRAKIVRDTMPRLGSQTAETEEGEVAFIPKEYEFFVTIE